MRDRLKSLTQTKSIHVYLNTFELLIIRISDASLAGLLPAFIWGLKDRVKAKLCLRNPSIYTEAARMALDIDEHLRLLYR